MLPLYLYTFDENEDAVIMDFNSLVDMPAHLKNFVTFKAQKSFFSAQKPEEKHVYAVASEEKRLVMGVLVSAGTPIYRHEPQLGEYFGVFTKSFITTLKERLMKQGLIHNLNTQHDSGNVVNGAFMTDIFQVDSVKGIGVPESLKDQNIQDGSLIAVYKITDDRVWKDVQTGKYLGFSIEAYLDVKPFLPKGAKFKSKYMKKPELSLAQRFAKFFKKENFATATLEDGTAITYEGDLVGSTPKMTDESGEEVMLQEGTHVVTLEDGTQTSITVDANGVVTAEAPVEPNPEQMTAADVRKEVEELVEEFGKKFQAQEDRIAALETENKELGEVLEELSADKGNKFARRQNKPAGGEGGKSWKDFSNK